MVLMAKLSLLKKETRCREKVEKMNANLMIKLATLCEQMDNVVAVFRISQPFFNEYGIFYGERFDYCLK